MKKVSSFLIILFLLTISSLTLVQGRITSIRQNRAPLDGNTVKMLEADSKGSSYLLIEGRVDTEIIKVDRNGVITQSIPLTANADDFDFSVSKLFIDSGDHLYVSSVEWSKTEPETRYAAITRFDSSGDGKKLVLRKKLDEALLLKDFHFAAMSDDRKTIYGAWEIDNVVTVFTIPINNPSQVATIFEYNLKTLPRTVELQILPGGGVIYTNVIGQVMYGDTGGKVSKLYPADGVEAIATDLCFIGDNAVSFYDAYANKLMKVVPGKEPQVLAEEGPVLNSELELTISDLSDIHTTSEGRLSALVRDGETIRLATGGYSRVDLSLQVRFLSGPKPYVYLAGIILRILLLTLLIWDFYCRVLKMHLSILIKQGLAVMSSVIILVFFINTFASAWLVKEFLIYENSTSIVNSGFMLVNEASKMKLSSFRKPSDIGDPSYQHIKETVLRPQLSSSDYDVLQELKKDMVLNIYTGEKDGTIRVFSSEDSPIGIPVNRLDLNSRRIRGLGKSMESDNPEMEELTDYRGDWMYMYVPLTTSDGFKGVVEVGLAMEDYSIRHEALQQYFIQGMIIMAFVVLLIILGTIISTLKSIRKLNKGVDQIGAGNFNVRTRVNSGDELEHLSNKFNDMVSFIQDHVRRLGELNKSYYRFIPEQFIRLLGVDSIENVKQGDNIKQHMAILHLQVRSFFDLTANMESEEIFDFINGVFQRFSPIVKSFNGIVDRFMDTGFTAVYLDYPENAVHTALRIQEKLAVWNLERSQMGLAKVHVGIVIDYGSVMLGVIGDGNRLSSAAVSQSFHTAAILEDIGAQSNVSILATGNLVSNMPPEVFKNRYIGLVKIGGADMDLYDFYEGDEFSIRQRKEAVLNSLKLGVQCFQNKDYYKARGYFIEVLSQLPEDGVGRKYLQLSDTYYHSKDAESVYYA